ncbi:MAG: universal stress protein [Deltaproteobacteria bacterium]|nr:universal stress protein [Deltaproteobacteria bacterium]
MTDATTPALARFERILVAVDSSPDSEAATLEAVELARRARARVAGLHVYAAKLHDLRFRQMEGVLPPELQKEDELEKQRTIHDKLITRGLGMISDSYLDQTERACDGVGVAFERVGAEGKNYRVILEHLDASTEDLLVMGFHGLGAGRADVPGTVCARVARKTSTDILVVREGARRLGDGPIVVGVDGSDESFGAVLTGVELGRLYGAPVQLVAVYDPDFHSVAFRRIGEVISERGARVFRLQDQEKLHTDIIDTGLANIYQSHLEVAARIALGAGLEVSTELLAGKPYEAILAYLEESCASLVIVGKVGVHADAGLDIGGNAERLLQLSKTPVLLSCRSHAPPQEIVAEQTLSFTEEADAALARVPAPVAPMVRKAIVGWALERGHAVVTATIVAEATQELLSGMIPGGERG